MKKSIIVILMVLFVMCGCTKEKETKIINHSINNVNNTNEILDSEEIEQIISEGNYILLDVRTNSEYEELHVVDSINIPYDMIDESISLDKEKTILVYCKSGKRAAAAMNTLISLGYNVYNIGGINDLNLEKISNE